MMRKSGANEVRACAAAVALEILTRAQVVLETEFDNAAALSLYESLGTDGDIEAPGTKVTRTQWLDLSSLEMANLIGKNVLIVDEVDDTRTTLEYAVKELQKDVEEVSKKLGRESENTEFSIFVLHVSAGFL